MAKTARFIVEWSEGKFENLYWNGDLRLHYSIADVFKEYFVLTNMKGEKVLKTHAMVEQLKAAGKRPSKEESLLTHITQNGKKFQTQEKQDELTINLDVELDKSADIFRNRILTLKKTAEKEDEKVQEEVKPSPVFETMLMVMSEKLYGSQLAINVPGLENLTVEISVAAVSPGNSGRLLCIKNAEGRISYGGKYNNATLLLEPNKMKTTLHGKVNTGQLLIQVMHAQKNVTHDYSAAGDYWFMLHIKSV